MRLAPKSLAGQLTLLLLLALALAQGVAVALFAWERMEALRDAHRDNAVLRTATVARLLGDTPPGLHDSVIAAASTELARFSLTAEPVVGETDASERAAAIAGDLSAALGVGAERVRVAPLWTLYPGDDDGWDDDHDRDHDDDDRDHDGDDDHDHGPDHREPDWFTASVALTDGRWLNVAVGPPPGAPAWGWPFVAVFLLSALCIAGVAVFTARRMAKPMRALAAAAGRLGRGEAVDDLPEAGTVETRETVRAFNLMRTRLDRYVRDRTAMLAAVSHDLRTPITSLRLHAEFVEDAETKGEDPRRARRDAADDRGRARLHPRGHATGRDADGRPACAGRQRGRRSRGTRACDIAVADSRNGCLPSAGRRRCAGHCATCWRTRPPTEDGRRYGLSGTMLEIRVVVEDEGPGIPEADLERVFEPFVRLEASRSRDTGGSGLGLAIARSIVRGHGGDIALGNRAEGGLRATVALPGARRS